MVKEGSPPALEDLISPPIKNKKFVFADEVKKIRIDIGLSSEAHHSCEWLVNNDDVGVIGIEANPSCQRNLELGGTTNSYTNCLYFLEEKICKFVGYVSEVFWKKYVRGLDLSKPEYSLTLMSETVTMGENTFYIVPCLMQTSSGPFRFIPLLQHVKDVKGKYVLIRGAVDNVKGEDKVVYQPFYSTPKDLGTSSLRRDILEDWPEKGAFHEIEVPSFSLEAVVKYVDWDKYSFIECVKIDVECKELDVLKSCEKYLDKIIFFRVEAFEQTDVESITYGDDKKVIKFLEDNNFQLLDKVPGDYRFVNKKYINDLPLPLGTGCW